MQSQLAPHLGHAAPAGHRVQQTARQPPQAVPVAQPHAPVSAVGASDCSERLGALNFEGQLLLKSLTWPQLERWCAANGAPLVATELLAVCIVDEQRNVGLCDSHDNALKCHRRAAAAGQAALALALPRRGRMAKRCGGDRASAEWTQPELQAHWHAATCSPSA